MKALLIFAMLIIGGTAIAQEPPTWVGTFGNVHAEDGTTWHRDAFGNWISDDGTVCREDAFGDWYCERGRRK